MTDAMWPTPDLDQEWKADAACRGMDTRMFFPDRGDTRGVQAAKAVCQRCAVAEECLNYALKLGEKFGIWGGLAERQRRIVRRDSGGTQRVRIVRCGTANGYRQHLRLEDPPCLACKDAYARYAQALRPSRANRGDAA